MGNLGFQGFTTPADDYRYSPDDPPGNPTVWDDEFNGSYFNPKWTFANWPSGSLYEVKNGAAHLYAPNSGTYRLAAMYQTIPEIDATYRAKITFEALNAAYGMVGIGFGNETNKAVTEGIMHHASGRVNYLGKWTNFATLSSEAFGGPNYDSKVYYEAKRSGTNLIFSVSSSGYNFQPIFTEAISSFLSTVTRIILFIHPYNCNVNATIEWFRRVA